MSYGSCIFNSPPAGSDARVNGPFCEKYGSTWEVSNGSLRLLFDNSRDVKCQDKVTYIHPNVICPQPWLCFLDTGWHYTGKYPGTETYIFLNLQKQFLKNPIYKPIKSNKDSQYSTGIQTSEMWSWIVFSTPPQSEVSFDDKMRHFFLKDGLHHKWRSGSFTTNEVCRTCEFTGVSHSRTWVFCPCFSIIGFSNVNTVLGFPASRSHCCLLLGLPDSMLWAAIPMLFWLLPFTASVDRHKAYPESMLSYSRNNSMKHFCNFQWAAQVSNVWTKSHIWGVLLQWTWNHGMPRMGKDYRGHVTQFSHFEDK